MDIHLYALKSGRLGQQCPLFSDFNIESLVATLPGVWHYWICARTGRPSVSRAYLGETASLICSVCLTVAAQTIWGSTNNLRHHKQSEVNNLRQHKQSEAAQTIWGSTNNLRKTIWGSTNNHLSTTVIETLACCWDVTQATDRHAPNNYNNNDFISIALNNENVLKKILKRKKENIWRKDETYVLTTIFKTLKHNITY